MQVHVHSIQFKADYKLVHFIESKLEKLQHLNHDLIDARVYLRLDKNAQAGNKVAEIKVNAPGAQHFAKRQAASFEESTDLVIEALRRQMRRYKGKHAI